MDKCKGCGRFKLFSKFEKGLCPSCLDRLFPDGGGAFGITKDMFLNSEKYMVEDKPLTRSLSDEIPGSVVTENGSRLDCSLLPSVFDFEGIKRIDGNLYELTSEKNIEKAKSDIISLNQYIDEAARFYSGVSAERFDPSMLKFRFDPYANTRYYCTICFAPLTKTGKPPKHQIKLRTMQKNDLSCEISYDNNGELSRVKIHHYTVDRITDGYSISCHTKGYQAVVAKENKTMKLRFVYSTNDGANVKIYDSKSIPPTE